MVSARRGLLIGNSRWHWAEPEAKGWRFCHSPPDPSQLFGESPAWAAVGKLSSRFNLDPEQRIVLSDVPLGGCPPWLGVDRALGAWAAWRISQRLQLDLSQGLLLVDAGTVLSQTLLNHQGEFQGGQLMPGLQLQLSAMASGTQALSHPTVRSESIPPFPQATSEAMVRGAIQAMVSSVLESSRRSRACVWICGGDADIVASQIDQTTRSIHVDRDVVMKGLVALIKPLVRSNPDR